MRCPILPLLLVLPACNTYILGTGGSRPGTLTRLSRTDEIPLDPREGEILRLSTPYGRIEVSESGEDAPGLRAEIVLFARDLETAKAALGKIRLESRRREGKVWIEVLGEPGDPGISIQVHYRARVRRGQRLELESRNGSLLVDGGFPDSELASTNGDIEIHGLTGDLKAETRNGKVLLEAFRGRECEIKSTYGEVSLENIQASRVQVESRNGSVEMEGVRAKRILATSSYGAMEFQGISGGLLVRNRNGDILAVGLSEDRHEIQSTHGKVTVRGAGGDLQVKSTNGPIRIEDFKGEAELSTTHGDVKLEGILTRVLVFTHSGRIRVKAQEGSRAEGNWKLGSRYGDITLSLPPDFEGEFDLKTTHGKLRMDFPLDGAKFTDSRNLSGRLGQGGKRIGLESRNGNLEVRKL